MKVIRFAGLWKKKDKQGNLLLSRDLNEILGQLLGKTPLKMGIKTLITFSA